MRGQVARDGRKNGIGKGISVLPMDLLTPETWPVRPLIYCDRCGLEKRETCMQTGRKVHSACGNLSP